MNIVGGKILISVVKGSTLGIILALLIRAVISRLSNVVSKDFLNDKNINKMEMLFEKHKETVNLSGASYSVKEFSLKKNTFVFKNLGTNTSSEGNCFGFSFLTSQVFGDSLIKVYKEKDSIIYDLSFIKKTLSEYELDNETAADIYSDEEEEDSCSYQKPTFLYNKGREKLINPKQIYKEVFAHHDTFTEYKKNNQNDQMIQILRAIEFYQAQFENKQKNFRVISSLPSVYKEKSDAYFFNISYILPNLISHSGFKTTKKMKDLIIQRLKKNKLVVLGIYNPRFSGHSVMAYKYEKIDDETIKIYVYDSNIPLLKQVDDDSIQINNDIENNGYILFKKMGHKWQYIYSPVINGNFLYNGVLNSCVPNTRIAIVEPSRKYYRRAI